MHKTQKMENKRGDAMNRWALLILGGIAIGIGIGMIAFGKACMDAGREIIYQETYQRVRN